MKRCTKCSEVKDVTKFSPRKIARDGLRSWCKNCSCEAAAIFYRNNIEAKRAYDYVRNRLPDVVKRKSEWKKTDRVRAYNREYQKLRAQKDCVKRSKALWRANNPEKKKAEARAQYVHRQKQPCEWCGHEERVVRHHPDYNKPLDIMWLCNPCHSLWHKMYIATPLRECA